MNPNFKLKAQILKAKADALEAEINLLAKEYIDAEESSGPLNLLETAAKRAKDATEFLGLAEHELWNDN